MENVDKIDCEILAELFALGQRELDAKGETLQDLIINNGLMCFLLGRRAVPTVAEANELKEQVREAARDIYMQATKDSKKYSTESLLEAAKRYDTNICPGGSHSYIPMTAEEAYLGRDMKAEDKELQQKLGSKAYMDHLKKLATVKE
jgi:hypothetical protein